MYMDERSGQFRKHSIFDLVMRPSKIQRDWNCIR